MLVRVAPELRKRLERDARRAGRSLSSEVERQLNDALRAVPPADPQTRALCYLIASIVRFASRIPQVLGGPGVADAAEFNWRTNRRDFETFRLVILRLLNQFAPAESQVSPDELLEGVEVDVKEEAKALWIVLYSLLYAPQEEAYAMAAEYGAETGSPLYAFPQAARDLNLRNGEDG